MGKRLSKKHQHARDHEAEAWCLVASVEAGTWAAAGLHREVIDGRVAGYWKLQGCGCLFVIELVDAS